MYLLVTRPSLLPGLWKSSHPPSVTIMTYRSHPSLGSPRSRHAPELNPSYGNPQFGHDFEHDGMINSDSHEGVSEGRNSWMSHKDDVRAGDIDLAPEQRVSGYDRDRPPRLELMPWFFNCLSGLLYSAVRGWHVCFIFIYWFIPCFSTYIFCFHSICTAVICNSMSSKYTQCKNRIFFVWFAHSLGFYIYLSMLLAAPALHA